MKTDWRPDFEQALGESFGEAVCPPVPFEDASPHECCEVVWAVAGADVTPTMLAELDGSLGCRLQHRPLAGILLSLR